MGNHQNMQGDASERRMVHSTISSPPFLQYFSIPNRQITSYGKCKYVTHFFGQRACTQRKLVWRGAAPQGRKRVGSSSPPRVSQSAKKVKCKFNVSAHVNMQLIFFLPSNAIASVACCQER
jgi:hypothetical protein